MFVTCAGVLDKNTMKWNSNDITDQAKCCHDQCNGPVQFCYDYCDKNILSGDVMMKHKCSEMCEHQRKICLETCSLIGDDVGENNKYRECAVKKGCELIDKTLDLKCLEKNKAETIDCCIKSCKPSSDIDCDKNCNYLHSFYMNQPPQLKKPEKQFSLQTNFWYLIYKIIIITNLVIVVLYCIFSLLKRN